MTATHPKHTHTMSKIKTALHRFFDTLDCDLHHSLADGLAQKINNQTGLKLTAADITREYEIWQQD
jgi:hypothetical protein